MATPAGVYLRLRYTARVRVITSDVLSCRRHRAICRMLHAPSPPSPVPWVKYTISILCIIPVVYSVYNAHTLLVYGRTSQYHAKSPIFFPATTYKGFSCFPRHQRTGFFRRHTPYRHTTATPSSRAKRSSRVTISAAVIEFEFPNNT